MSDIVQAYRKLIAQFIILSIICVLFSGGSFAASISEGIQIYQKNLSAYPEHKQRLADDITRYRNADNIWDVLREEFTLAHYEDNPAVQDKVEWFMNNQDYLLRSASRAAPYLYYILQQVKKRHLPAELVLLPIIESGYNPFNVSNVGAAGIWQLMPETASGLGVKHNGWYDGRRDLIASTRAALNYLAYLQSFFEGNWLYAAAAYNTGEGNVLSAIKRNIRDGKDTDFWSLPVAQATKDYVPSLLALAIIISNPKKYPIYFPPVRNAPYLAQVDIEKQINLKYAASLAGISYKKLIQLNPGFGRTSSSTRGGPTKLVLPIENVEQFTENLTRSPLNTKINWVHYKVKSGDTLVSLAKKFSTSATALRKMNHLGSKNNVHYGMNLLIPYSKAVDNLVERNEDAATKEDIANTNLAMAENTHKEPTPFVEIKEEKLASNYTLKPGDTIYMVRNKDTLEKIAKHFHINSKNLIVANQLKTKKIKPGKQLIIPTHLIGQAEKIQPGDTIYMIRHGDTIEKIAKKFHTSASALRLANLVDDSGLAEGEKIIVPTHMRG